MQGASGLFGSLLGAGAGSFGLSIIAGLGAAMASGWLGAVSRRRRDLLEPAFAGAVVLSLFGSPHLLGHDLTLLAPAAVAALAWTTARDASAAGAWPGRRTMVALAQQVPGIGEQKGDALGSGR